MVMQNDSVRLIQHGLDQPLCVQVSKVSIIYDARYTAFKAQAMHTLYYEGNSPPQTLSQNVGNVYISKCT